MHDNEQKYYLQIVYKHVMHVMHVRAQQCHYNK